MKAFVEITQSVEIEIPDEKVPEIMKPYNDLILSGGDEEDMVEHIAYNVVINQSDFIEGIGNLNNLESIKVIYDRNDIEIETEIFNEKK